MSQPIPKLIDYKNAKQLEQYITPHARIVNGRKSDLPAREQRKLQTAIKRARFMALLPYISR